MFSNGRRVEERRPRAAICKMSEQPRLLDRVREKIRVKHYSIRTETAYVGWIKRFILFHDKKHPEMLGAKEVEAFLSDLATTRNVAASTQNRALNAILFLYREVLEMKLDRLRTTGKRPGRFARTTLSSQSSFISRTSR